MKCHRNADAPSHEGSNDPSYIYFIKARKAFIAKQYDVNLLRRFSSAAFLKKIDYLKVEM